MSTSSASSNLCVPVPITNLTMDKSGDVNLWIGRGKQYYNVPEFVCQELCCHTSALSVDAPLLPASLLPVSLLLNFYTPPVTQSLKGIKPETIFSHNSSKHTSSECLKLSAPSHGILNALMACAGQAMLHGKTSVQHWDQCSIFLLFNALGSWALIIEAETAKNAWRDAMTWLYQQCKTTPAHYIPQVIKLLGCVSWKSYNQGPCFRTQCHEYG